MANRIMTLEFDEDDWHSVQEAMKQRAAIQIDGKTLLPDYESSLEGCLVAEICRGWMEHLRLAKAAKGKKS